MKLNSSLSAAILTNVLNIIIFRIFATREGDDDSLVTRQADQCYGKQVVASCDRSQLVRVTDASYTQTVLCTTGATPIVEDDDDDDADPLRRMTTTKITPASCIKTEKGSPSCVGNSSCSFVAPWVYLSSGCGYSNSFSMSYQCVPNHRLISVCSRTMTTDRRGYISTPNYPSSYPSEDADCTLTIVALPGDRIAIYLLDIYVAHDLDGDPVCIDRLWITDGFKTTDSMCVRRGRGLVFTSSANQATVRFTSSTRPSSTAGVKGFWLYYESFDATLPNVVQPVQHSGAQISSNRTVEAKKQATTSSQRPFQFRPKGASKPFGRHHHQQQHQNRNTGDSSSASRAAARKQPVHLNVTSGFSADASLLPRVRSPSKSDSIEEEVTMDQDRVMKDMRQIIGLRLWETGHLYQIHPDLVVETVSSSPFHAEQDQTRSLIDPVTTTSLVSYTTRKERNDSRSVSGKVVAMSQNDSSAVSTSKAFSLQLGDFRITEIGAVATTGSIIVLLLIVIIVAASFLLVRKRRADQCQAKIGNPARKSYKNVIFAYGSDGEAHSVTPELSFGNPSFDCSSSNNDGSNRESPAALTSGSGCAVSTSGWSLNSVDFPRESRGSWMTMGACQDHRSSESTLRPIDERTEDIYAEVKRCSLINTTNPSRLLENARYLIGKSKSKSMDYLLRKRFCSRFNANRKQPPVIDARAQLSSPTLNGLNLDSIPKRASDAGANRRSKDGGVATSGGGSGGRRFGQLQQSRDLLAQRSTSTPNHCLVDLPYEAILLDHEDAVL